MKAKKLTTHAGKTIEGPLLLTPEIFSDSRGFFMESWNHNRFSQLVGESIVFYQDNHSSSRQHVLRGLHYQLPPDQQGKLVRCVIGEIFDVAVDLRKGSPTFGQWVGEKINANNNQQLWVPPGFAHGFLTLSNTAEVLYKATSFWNANSEQTIRWNDPSLAIDWPKLKSAPKLSKKDSEAPLLEEMSTSLLFP